MRNKEIDLDLIVISIFSSCLVIFAIIITGYWVGFRNQYCNAVGLELFGRPLTWFECLVI